MQPAEGLLVAESCLDSECAGGCRDLHPHAVTVTKVPAVALGRYRGREPEQVSG
jgi:hypothetical protein